MALAGCCVVRGGKKPMCWRMAGMGGQFFEAK